MTQYKRQGPELPTRAVAALAIGCLAAPSCASDPDGTPTGLPELELSEPRVVVGEGDALLAAPIDIAIDDQGTVYVLDRQDVRIVAVAPDGTAETFGE